jgi:hypothetical protein
MTERAIVLRKLEGIRDEEARKELGLSHKRYRCAKKAIRAKIEDYFTTT